TSNIAPTMVDRANPRLAPAQQSPSNSICSVFCRKVPAGFASLFRLWPERPLPPSRSWQLLAILIGASSASSVPPRDSSPFSLLRSPRRRVLPTPKSFPIHGSNDTNHSLCNNCDIVASESRDITLRLIDRVSD